jgi:hypothetical protein
MLITVAFLVNAAYQQLKYLWAQIPFPGKAAAPDLRSSTWRLSVSTLLIEARNETLHIYLLELCTDEPVLQLEWHRAIEDGLAGNPMVPAGGVECRVR